MHETEERMKLSTKCIHSGNHPDPSTGAIMPPIYQTSTYVQEAPGKHKGFEYSRTQNPTRKALEENLAAIENGRHGLCFASGMAATSTAIELLKSGDHVISGGDVYGGTYRVFTKVFTNYHIGFDFVDTTDVLNVKSRINEKTRMIWLESPTNPMLRLADIEEISKLAKSRGILVAVDNTFATPALQNPLDLGADIVVHSTTKYLGGHSDVVGGALIVNDDGLRAKLAFLQNSMGAVPGPMDCFLTLRGTKTLAVRMKQHCENALTIARWLSEHKKVKEVHYPGLESHPQHQLAKKQMRGFGGMISFSMDATLEDSVRAVSSTKIFSLAESLGGVESLIEHPASMTHASIPREERLKLGFEDGLIRLSVGIEDVDDLIEDLAQAMG
ncbi:MAG: cystathionine gamma-synthase [Planctomycetes bacterium]|nr:cystathionine gamma-synthase [Planctomycetota bacterium]